LPFAGTKRARRLHATSPPSPQKIRWVSSSPPTRPLIRLPGAPNVPRPPADCGSRRQHSRSTLPPAAHPQTLAPTPTASSGPARCMEPRPFFFGQEQRWTNGDHQPLVDPRPCPCRLRSPLLPALRFGLVDESSNATAQARSPSAPSGQPSEGPATNRFWRAGRPATTAPPRFRRLFDLRPARAPLPGVQTNSVRPRRLAPSGQ